MSRNKYGAKKVVIDGIKFDSKREAQRYTELKLLERAGEITDLKLQPRYYLENDHIKVVGRNKHPLFYTADFEYIEKGERVIEDVKGMITQASSLRMAVFAAIYGIWPTIVK